MRVFVRVVVLLCGVLLVWVAPACAVEELAFPQASFSPFGPQGAGTFSHPTGVAVNEADSEVFVADGEPANVVDIFSAQTGSLLGSIAGTGSETFSFASEAAGVAVDQANGRLYVSDVRHNVVDEFERSGTGAYRYVCQFNGWYGAGVQGCHASGGTPKENEEIVEPLGVAVDTQGDVYIASFGPGGPGLGAVDEFNQAGEGVVRIAGTEHPVLIGNPKDIAVDSKGDLFVLNYTEGQRIAEFQRGSFTGGVESEKTFDPSTYAIALNPADDDLYVDNSGQVKRYVSSSAGEWKLEGEFGGGALGDSEGLAITTAAGSGGTPMIYASNIGKANVDVFTERLVKLPDIDGGCQASGASTDSVVLGGEVDPLGLAGASYSFEYGVEESYGQQTAVGLVEGSGPRQVVPVEVGGLEPGTLYHCRLSVSDSEDEAFGVFAQGPDSTVETLPLLPAVNEPPASARAVTSSSAILDGMVTPGGNSTYPDTLATTSYHFEYGSETGRYSEQLPSVGVGAGSEPVAVEQAIPTGTLQPGTTYHFALVASNAAGASVGEDETFTTPSTGSMPVAPVVSTGAPSGVSQTTATLNGSVDPEGAATTFQFELGTTTAYGTVLFGGAAGSAPQTTALTQAAAGLLPGTTYHYRVCATNAAGTVCGTDAAFTTTGFPGAIVQPLSPALIPFTTVAFPKQTGTVPAGKDKAKRHKLSAAQRRLQRLLRSCRRERGKAKRGACERAAKHRSKATRSPPS